MQMNGMQDEQTAVRQEDELYTAWKQACSALSDFERALRNSRSPGCKEFSISYPSHGQGGKGRSYIGSRNDLYGWDLWVVWVPRDGEGQGVPGEPQA